MATFDRETREIVLRIVYDGAATAGKTANLRSLHASFGHRAQGTLYTPAETGTGRTLYFDWLELMAGHVDEWPIRCQLVTVPGQFAFAERRYRLLRGIDAAVVVCESTPQGVLAARAAWTFLSGVLAAAGNERIPVVVQANKQDLPGALSPARIAALLALDPKHRVLPARALDGDGVRTTFLAALDAARDVVRAKLRIGGPESLGTPMESAEHLYDAMLREADADPEPGFVAALDGALAAVATDEAPSVPPLPADRPDATAEDPRSGPPSHLKAPRSCAPPERQAP